jgi:protein-L-isoaspartate(D-aspartate) O-methyltransferase
MMIRALMPLRLAFLTAGVLSVACQPIRNDATGFDTVAGDSSRAAPEPTSATEQRYAEQRRHMVERHLRSRDITDPRVLEVMGRVPRHLFVPDPLRGRAYADGPLPIGLDQTISQPYIVALMTQLARPKPEACALDIGTGSGYQAAVLAELVEKVYSIEILCPLAEAARARLETLGYTNVEVRCGDGYRGWPEHAPFDLIILAAAPDHIPEPLIEQLAPGGRLVLPVGGFYQELVVVEKRPDGTVSKDRIIPVRFVPMTGEAEKPGKGRR